MSYNNVYSYGVMAYTHVHKVKMFLLLQAGIYHPVSSILVIMNLKFVQLYHKCSTSY